MANVIDYMFFLETKHVYYHWDGRSGELFEELSAFYLHELALITLDEENNFDDEATFGLIYPQLMSYDTAASFIYYLLEHKGTKNDFMQVFDNINLAEEVYGVDMDLLIEEWLGFLKTI